MGRLGLVSLSVIVGILVVLGSLAVIASSVGTASADGPSSSPASYSDTHDRWTYSESGGAVPLEEGSLQVPDGDVYAVLEASGTGLVELHVYDAAGHEAVSVSCAGYGSCMRIVGATGAPGTWHVRLDGAAWGSILADVDS